MVTASKTSFSVTKGFKKNLVETSVGMTLLLVLLGFDKSSGCGHVEHPLCSSTTRGNLIKQTPNLMFFSLFTLWLIFFSFIFFYLVLICHFSALPISPFTVSPSLSLVIQLLSLSIFSLCVFLLFLLYCSLVHIFFHQFLPSTFCLAFSALLFPHSVLSSSSSLLHHKVDGWMIHSSLCPRTVVILILLLS